MCLPRALSALTLVLCSSALTLSAQAQSFDVHIIGTITPAACLPTLAGGGIVDYGIIPAATLQMTSFNPLPTRSLPFTIVCSAPTRVALRGYDNRPLLPGEQFSVNSQYGLGRVGTDSVGAYDLLLTPGTFTADGTPVFQIINPIINDGQPFGWINSVRGLLFSVPGFMSSWSATQGGQPVAFANLSGTLSVETTLNRGGVLPMTNEVPLDGLATLELVYL